MAKTRNSFTVSDGEMMLVLEPAEKGWYTVTSPLDPQLITQAKSLEKAFEMAYDAAALLQEARAEAFKLSRSRKK